MKEGWTYKKLGEVCNIDFGNRVVKSRDAGSIYPVYGGGGATFKMDTFNREDCVVISRFGMSEQCTRIVKGKFFLNDSGLTLSLKNPCMVQPFMDWQILSLNNKIYSLGRGAAQKNLDTKALAELTISYPEISKQEQVVERLDAAFENIDKLKANAEKQLAEVQTLFQKSLAKAMKPKEGWEVVKLESLCTDVVDCPHSTPRKAEHPTQYPCIRTSELKGGNIEWSSMQYLEEEEYIVRTARIKPQCNDIVYGREGTYGDAVLLPEGYFFSLGQRTMLFRPNIGKVVPKFLHYNVISSHVYEQAKAKNSGCGVGHVNVKDIKLFDIGIPKSLAEQQRIVERLDALSENIRKYEEIQRQIISECDALKQALLRKVFE